MEKMREKMGIREMRGGKGEREVTLRGDR